MLHSATRRLSWRRQASLLPSRSLVGIAPSPLQPTCLATPPSQGQRDGDYDPELSFAKESYRPDTRICRLPALSVVQFYGPFHGSPPRLLKHQRIRVDQDGAQYDKDSSSLLRSLLCGKDEKETLATKYRIARMSPNRLPIIVMRMIVQSQAERSEDHELLELLRRHPTPDLTSMGYTEQDVQHFCHVLTGLTDDVRCERLLAWPRPQPVFLINFLLRRQSSFYDPLTLAGLIDHCRLWYNGQREWEKEPTAQGWIGELQALRYTQDMDVPNFRRLIGLLSWHCVRLDPRLIVKVAELAAARIESMSSPAQNPDMVFRDQCSLYNECLEAFQLKFKRQAPLVALPNEYLWEAQRIMLAMSSTFERPLLVSDRGFRAIRHTLSGLPKNTAERHSSGLHSPNWPPYLLPADGMDEGLEAEDFWSRPVQAGVMMQEAGFSKDEVDESLDVLQGVAPDGTPTIQQRITVRLGRVIKPWEASIRATRNATEAWTRFKTPPAVSHTELAVKPEPGPDEYAAMFEKLAFVNVKTGSDIAPGDKARNFPTAPEANLTDLERVRLQPPSTSQLYQDMRASGVKLNAQCLRILLENANSYEVAHEYLRDAARDSGNNALLCLTDLDPDRTDLVRVDMGVFSSYIQMCARTKTPFQTRRYLGRAIRLIDKRLGPLDSRWTVVLWRPILKLLDLPANMLGLSGYSQMQLLLHAVEKIEAHDAPPLSVFVHICRCLRSSTRRELFDMTCDAEDEPGKVALRPRTRAQQLLFDVYFKSGHRPHTTQRKPERTRSVSADETTENIFHKAAELIKRLFHALVDKERTMQSILRRQQIPPMARMLIRKDPVRADHAHDYMLAMAFMGDFEEMLATAKWLVREWGQEQVAEALSDAENLPEGATLSFPLCAYRLLAEPRLDPVMTDMLREGMEDRGLGWMWPSDEAVTTYRQGTKSQAAAKLSRLLSSINPNDPMLYQEGMAEEDPSTGGYEDPFVPAFSSSGTL